MLWTHSCATLAPAVFGFAVDNLGGFTAGWLVTAGCVVIGMVILYFLVRTGPKRRTYDTGTE